MSTDAELISRSIHRDHRAFAELFDQHAPAVYRYAHSVTSTAADAQDLTQQTFVTAWRRLADIRLVGGSMLPWLIVCCRNHAHNLRRAAMVRRTSTLPDIAQPSFESGNDSREELAVVLEAIKGLSEADQMLVRLCVLEDHSYAQAARVIGGSPARLAKRMERARRVLRATRASYRQEGARS